MKFGTMNLFPLGEGASDRKVMDEVLEDAVLADELGFDSIWLAEHHFSPYGILGNPLVFAAAIAQRTRRIKIGTAVMVIPFYSPIRLAEDAALVDVLSDGRLIMGIGRGYQPLEFAGFGIDPATSIDRYNETVDILRLAWTQENWSYEGKHFQYKDITIYPRPSREIPLLHAAVQPDSFKRLGERGERIITSPNFTPLGIMKKNFDLYQEGLSAGGHVDEGFERPFMQQAWCGPDQAGRHAAAEAAMRYYKSIGKVIPGADRIAGVSEKELDYYGKVRRGLDLLTVEQTLTHGGNFGSAQQIADTINVLSEQMGVDHYIGWFNIPTLDRRAALRSMEMFARDVMPMFKESTPKAAVPMRQAAN